MRGIRALAGLVMTLTPLSCQLMGWRGSDPGGYANNGAHWFCGGLLLFLGGLLEFFLAHTFAFVVYCSYGMSASHPVPCRPSADISQADSSSPSARP